MTILLEYKVQRELLNAPQKSSNPQAEYFCRLLSKLNKFAAHFRLVISLSMIH